MQNREFYPKKGRQGWFWKTFSFLLLMGGASSVIDIEKVVLEEDRLVIKYFLANDIILPYSRIKFIKYKSGGYKAIASDTDRLELIKMKDPAGLISALKHRIHMYNEKYGR